MLNNYTIYKHASTPATVPTTGHLIRKRQEKKDKKNILLKIVMWAEKGKSVNCRMIVFYESEYIVLRLRKKN